MEYTNRRKLKICDKCGLLDYHYGKAKYCRECNKKTEYDIL